MSAILIERKGGARVRYTGLPLPQLPAKLREFGQDALMATVKYWRRNMAPRHFMRGAFAIYQGIEPRVYQLRAAEYEEKKQRLFGHRDPLRFRGRLREEFLRGHMAIRTSGGGAAMKVKAAWPNLPKWAYQERSDRSPRKYAELTITTDDEGRTLARVYEKELQARLDAAAAGGAAASGGGDEGGSAAVA